MTKVKYQGTDMLRLHIKIRITPSSKLSIVDKTSGRLLVKLDCQKQVCSMYRFQVSDGAAPGHLVDWRSNAQKLISLHLQLQGHEGWKPQVAAEVAFVEASG